jgi:hypothetical protein
MRPRMSFAVHQLQQLSAPSLGEAVLLDISTA